MARRKLYPEGRTQMNVIVPVDVKDALDALATERGLSTSQYVTGILRAHIDAMEAIHA